MRNFLNFDEFLQFTKDFYENPYQVSKYVYFYVFYQFYTFMLLSRYLLFIIFHDNEESLEPWEKYDAFIHYFAGKTMQSNKLLVTCAIALMLYGSIIFHFTVFLFYEYEAIGVND